jgi:diguanylate cyclase (GGDEF)-like protein
MSAPPRDVLIAEVLANLAKPAGRLAFTPVLEEHYRATIAPDKRRSMITAALIGLTVLLAFVLLRALVLEVPDPDRFRVWIGSMAAISLVCLVGLVITATTHDHRLIDATTMTAAVIVSSLVCFSFRVEPQPVSAIGVYCYVMVPLAACSLANLHFRQALVTTVVALFFYVVMVADMPDLSPVVKWPAVLLVFSVGAMALWGNYRSDRDHRALFLFLARERLIGEISEARNAELKEMTRLDPLTGVANRRGFEERLTSLTAAGREVSFALVMIDIDHFKAFNDRFGHPEGDRCLTAVAMALTDGLRDDGDLLARLGGEEFALLLPGVDARAIGPIMERLRRSIEKLAIPSGPGDAIPPGVVTISLGASIVDPTSPAPRREALEQADRALYSAKNAGRNRWRIEEAEAEF